MIAIWRKQNVAGAHAAWLSIALILGAYAGTARAQMCSADGGCEDASASDAAMDAGASDTDGGLTDASVAGSDGGAMSGDAGMSFDGGASGDAGPTSTAACSCDIRKNTDGDIHVCAGSFEASVCRTLGCEASNVIAKRCPEQGVTLCCDLKSRGVYTNLYEDCTHPNCESGFRAECEDLGGRLIEGACESPELPDDPDTETGSGSCALSKGPSDARSSSMLLLLLLALVLRARRRARA